MQPIYKSSALTFVVLVLFIFLRSMDIDTQQVANQFLIFLSIVTATISTGILATKYSATLLSGRKRKARRSVNQ